MARNVRNDQILSPTNQQSDACVPTWPDSLMFWPFPPFLPLQDKKKKDLGNKKPKHCSRVDFASLFTNISNFADSKISQAPLTPPPHPQGGENGEAPAEGAGGFMGGIMGKANALKAKAAETAAAAGAGNLQVSRDQSLQSWKIFRSQSRVLKCSGHLMNSFSSFRVLGSTLIVFLDPYVVMIT